MIVAIMQSEPDDGLEFGLLLTKLDEREKRRDPMTIYAFKLGS
jgi:hypothetical protein